MNARQRNNITRLPQPVRYLICQLLDDGATYDEIRDTPEVAKRHRRAQSSASFNHFYRLPAIG